MIQNVEYVLEGGPAGVLLIHGLTGTPNEMRTLAKGLHGAGFTVYGVQLAGHCGSKDDLLATTWQDWYASVEAAADKLREQVDHLFVGGLSMGAVLALKLAAEQGDRIAGVGVYGPTFRYDGWSIPLYARRLNFLLTWFKRFKLFQDRCFDEQPPYGLKNERLRARVAASMMSGDSTEAGLASNPWPALAEMVLLAREVRKDLPRVTSPCLILHAAEDDIADVRNARLVADKVRGPVSFSLLHDSYHLITIDQERQQVIERSVAFFQDILAGVAPAEDDMRPVSVGVST